MRDEARRLRETEYLFDRDLYNWWIQQRMLAKAGGQEITTWDELAELLRAAFLPHEEREGALHNLLNIAQHSGESIIHYLLRADRLIVKARGTLGDHAIMQIVFDRMQKSEWPFTYAAARKAVLAKQVTGFAALRALLQREAMAEPGKRGERQLTMVTSGGSDKPHKSGGAQKHGAKRVAPVAGAQQQGSDDERTNDGAPGGASSSSITTAPLQKMPGKPEAGGKCLRCGKTGHLARDCSQPDKRTCYVCEQVGHISKTCPKRAADKAAAAGAGDSAPPKNGKRS